MQRRTLSELSGFFLAHNVFCHIIFCCIIFDNIGLCRNTSYCRTLGCSMLFDSPSSSSGKLQARGLLRLIPSFNSEGFG